MNKIILILLTLTALTLSTAYSATDTIITEGSCDIQTDKADARNCAIKQSLLTAAEKVMGVRITSISEGDQGGIYTVKIKATVQVDALNKAFSKIVAKLKKQISETGHNTAIGVNLTAYDKTSGKQIKLNDASFEKYTDKQLMDKGFDLCPNQQDITNVTVDKQISRDLVKKLSSIYKSKNTKYLLVGNLVITSIYESPATGYPVCEGDVYYMLTDTDSTNTVAEFKMHLSAMSMTDELTKDELIKKASVMGVRKVSEQLVSSWQNISDKL